MSDGKWKWWVGHDDERYHTECETRDEAVYIASEEQDGGHICEAKQHGDLRLASWFTAERFLEDADEMAYDDYADPDNNDPFFDCTRDQSDDLEARVRAAIEAWQDAHGLKFRSWKFAAQRNMEYVPPKEAE